MDSLDFYKQYSLFTYPGLYEAELRKLPDDVRELGLMVRQSVIHRTTLRYAIEHLPTEQRQHYMNAKRVN